MSTDDRIAQLEAQLAEEQRISDQLAQQVDNMRQAGRYLTPGVNLATADHARQVYRRTMS